MKRQREEEEAVRARAREQEAQAKTDEGEWEEIPPELLQEASPSFNPPDANGEAPVHAGPAQSSQGAIGENIDDDLAEALRLSLLDAESQRPSPGHADIHDQPSSATYIHDHIDAQGGESSSGSALQTGNNASSDAHQADAQGKEELDPDLAYAIQLSLAEEESRKHAEMLALQRGEDEDWAFLDNQGADTFSYENDDEEAKDDEEFPPLKGSKADKGKGKARA
ncbi:hypothetical protein KEM55_001575 [Ascosphaera atra]|nr:hypothetical protein KEM55_001575 [Ascosphaera atra]